ncbi:MAG: Uma2 family endonuclease [Pyrinomonadaceae bacterium]
MGLALRKKTLYSPEEYLEFERAAEVRHEYLDGEVFEMAGESLAHSQICANILGEVRQALKGTKCQPLSPNMKVRAETRGLFAYPDLSIVCGEPEFHDTKNDVLLNPKVIIEVLSPSTQRYDQTKKFFRYRKEIPTLTDYILIYQDMAFIEHHEKLSDGKWAFNVVEGLNEIFPLTSIGCKISMSEIYDRVKLPIREIEDDIEPLLGVLL